jgi:NADPH:quinone reductase-like Zn-dependent oxidoreductase
MKAKEVTITSLRRAELSEFLLDETLKENEVLGKTLLSSVSAGTETRCFNIDVQKKPDDWWGRRPGYGNIGQILAVGEKITNLQAGDVVFTTNGHSSHYKMDITKFPPFPGFPGAAFISKVPRELDLLNAAFIRMISVSITTVNNASLLAGDKVLILGQGLVGNFSAQLFQIAGANVMVADLIDYRLDKAKQCGIKKTVNPRTTDLKEAVMEWTNGEGAQIVVEAIGSPQVIAQAMQLARHHGEVLLVGSPRGETVMDVQPIFSRIHNRYVTMKGAWEFGNPIRENEFNRNSHVSNARKIFDWLEKDIIKTEPLLTHLVKPERCQEIYEGLSGGITGTLSPTSEYLGAVFDWR